MPDFDVQKFALWAAFVICCWRQSAISPLFVFNLHIILKPVSWENLQFIEVRFWRMRRWLLKVLLFVGRQSLIQELLNVQRQIAFETESVQVVQVAFKYGIESVQAFRQLVGSLGMILLKPLSFCLFLFLISTSNVSCSGCRELWERFVLGFLGIFFDWEWTESKFK